MPQVSNITGDIDVHDIAIDKQGRIVFANTLSCCLATVSHSHSCAPIWRPAYTDIDAIITRTGNGAPK